MPEPVTVYSAELLNTMLQGMEETLDAHADTTATREPEDLPEIRPAESLIGINNRVYDQINSAIRSGKRHLLFFGPPGTGKTELAQVVAGQLSENWHLLTGSSDWSSQDIIGGYMPSGAGQLRFSPGLLLQHFNDPLIIDELNRCDIDKVLGPLFTVLSGQGTTLPYHIDPSVPDSPRISIHPYGGAPEAGPRFVPGANWRLIATINTLDRSSLYQMSYALMRRFAWIYVGLPVDLPGFVAEYVRRTFNLELTAPAPLAEAWQHVNIARPLGPAPFIDMLRYLHAHDAGIDFAAPIAAAASTTRQAYLDALEVFVLPLLDGIRPEQAENLSTAMGIVFGEGSAESIALRQRLMELST